MKMFKISTVSIKIVTIVLLLVLSILPLKLIEDLIFDRKIYQNQAISSIVDPLGGETIIDSAFIALPYTKYEEKTDEKGKITKEEKTSYIIFTPENCDIDIDIDSYYLTRGIFKVPVFNGKMQIDISFDNLDYSSYGIDSDKVHKNDAVLLVDVSNNKSLISTPTLKVNNVDLKMSNIMQSFIMPSQSSLCYSLKNINLNQKIEIKGTLDFQGGKSFSIIPVASNNKINMISNWKTPGFGGGFLPKERNINKDGFSATWNVAGLNTVYPKSWIYGTIYNPEAIKVDLVQHIDNYTRAMRSVKYAFLFLLIPFLAMFVLEISTKRKIHPIQYILIGITNIMFYLLLISISEHLNFNLSYAICCLAVVLVSFIYIISIFKSHKCGYILCGIQLLSYIFLCATLQSEDYALLIGSVGLFIVVATFMLVTRKIDWYNAVENSAAC